MAFIEKPIVNVNTANIAYVNELRGITYNIISSNRPVFNGMTTFNRNSSNFNWYDNLPKINASTAIKSSDSCDVVLPITKDDGTQYYIALSYTFPSISGMALNAACRAVSDPNNWNTIYDNIYNPTSISSNGTYLGTQAPSELTIAYFYNNTTTDFGIFIAAYNSSNSNYYVSYAGIRLSELLKLNPAANGYYYGGSYEIEESSDEFGKASEPSGYGSGGSALGTFDDSSDIIGVPTMPNLGISSAGFVNIYKVSSGGLQAFGSELFPDLNFTPISSLPAPQSVTDALVNIAECLVNFGNQIPSIVDMYINNTLINYIIDCHIIPVSPQTATQASIKVGFKTFTQTADVVTSDYVDFDCGSLNIGEYYANYIDYEPYTQAKLYLPFVGFVDMKPEFFQSGVLSVKYRFNIIDGSFVCYVLSTSSKSKLSGTVIAQYGGNCCVHIPITGINYSSMVSGIVSGVSAVSSSQAGSQVPTGNTSGNNLISSAVNVANTKPMIQQSNGYNATTSFLNIRVPYLMIERSVANFSSNYVEENGLPSNINTSFSKLSGFTSSTDIILDGITGATKEELNEIAALLAEGVIL